MARIPYVKHLLLRWSSWHRKPRNSIRCSLNIENDVVDSTRRQSDLSLYVDFQMIRINFVIEHLKPNLKEAVFAVYGGKEVLGYQAASKRLGISRISLVRRINAADRAIDEALDLETKKRHELVK